MINWFTGATINSTNNILKFYFPEAHYSQTSYQLTLGTRWASETYSSSNARQNTVAIVLKRASYAEIHYLASSSFVTTFDAITSGY